jgi:hypothetical protein
MAFSGKVADYAPVYTGTVSEFDENALAVQPVISDGDVCLQLYCDARRSTDQHGTPFATVPAEAMETALPGEDTIASNTTAVWSTDGSFTVRYDIVYVGGGSEQDEDVYSKVSPDYIGPYANIGAR